MKKKVLTLTAMLVLVCSTAFAYVGNTRTGKFHRDRMQVCPTYVRKQQGIH